VSATVPQALARLVGRLDRDVFDVPRRTARIRLEVDGGFDWDVIISPEGAALYPAGSSRPDAEIGADAATWSSIADDLESGMVANQEGRLRVRRNLHLGIGFLAATSGQTEPGRLEFSSVETSQGSISVMSAGEGDPVVCLHGLGATKQSFIPTLAALSTQRRVISFDFPGFGDSAKPLDAAYDAPYFAGVVTEVLDALEIGSADLIGNSMGGRVAIETGLLYPERVDSLVLLTPALAWLRDRHWRLLLAPPLPKLGLVQPTPRALTEMLVRRVVPGGRDGWAAAGVDEFLRSFLTPRGRVAFYDSARNIYLDQPHGEEGLWTRLEGLDPPALFVWGKHDTLVPVGFRRHVERVLDSAQHLELDCGHVPQFEMPVETHESIEEFYESVRIRG